MLLKKLVLPTYRPATFCSVVPKSRSVTSMVGIGFGVFRLGNEKNCRFVVEIGLIIQFGRSKMDLEYFLKNRVNFAP